MSFVNSGRLDQPSDPRRSWWPSFNAEQFGSWSERFARYLGTPAFLIQMTVFCAIWLAWNWIAPPGLRFDPFPDAFLTLMLSLQASYAAPLILLAQNRQDDRDRQDYRLDRQRAQLATEANAYLARELADVQSRLASMSAQISKQPKLSRKDLDRRLNAIEHNLTLLLDRLPAAS